MGAETEHFVRVLRTVEDVVSVSAVTRSEAMKRAEKEPGVVTVLAIVSDDELQCRRDGDCTCAAEMFNSLRPHGCPHYR